MLKFVKDVMLNEPEAKKKCDFQVCFFLTFENVQDGCVKSGQNL
jgi:hypothetical protein